jgi:hypothetical protein
VRHHGIIPTRFVEVGRPFAQQHGQRWTYTFVDQLKQIPASAFVAVDESSLMCSPNSGQARDPGLPNGGCRS